jgi:hypothetical protein
MSWSTTTATSRTDMLADALRLAGEGHPILPLDGKTPRGGFGLSHATRDRVVIEAWFDRWPDANIGLRCDGLCVVDVDGEPGEESLDRLEHRLGPLPLTKAQATGKGQHMLFRVPVELGNSTSALGRPPGIDLRCGRRGYIVAAPSRHPSGRRYRWFDLERPLAALPASWLRALQRRRVLPASAPSPTGRTSAYGRAALRSELERLLRAEVGARNETLNLAVFRLAQLAAGGELDPAEIKHDALLVATLSGLPEDESRKTIESALHAGLRYRRRAGGRGDYRG